MFNNTKALIELNNLLNSNRKEKLDSVSALFSLVIFGLITAIIILFLSNLIINFKLVNAEYELLIFILFILMTLQAVWSTFNCVKVFFSTTQNEILLKFPISARELFLSKFIFTFVRDLIFGLAMLLPVLNIYGVMLHLSYTFFIMTPFVAFFCTLLSFLIGALLSFPFVFLKMYLSNKFLLTLILFIVVIVSVFYGYMQVINGVLDISNTISFNINSKIIDAIVYVSALIYPAVLLSKMLFFNGVFVNIIIFLLLTAAGIAALIFLEEFAYKKMLEKGAGADKTYYGKKSRFTPKTVMGAMLGREFITVSRNTGYLFQYFAFILITPLMVYLCAESSTAISFQNIGNIIQPIVAFFVICVFSVVTNSFAAMALSREGTAFFLTKIYPVKPAAIIFSKLFFSGIASAIAITASCVTLGIFRLIGWADVFFIILAATLFSIAHICWSIFIDLKNPQFVDEYDVAKSDRNTSIVIVSGLIICLLVGIIGLFSLLIWGATAMLAVLSVISALLATGFVLLLFTGINKRYQKILC